MFSATAKPTQSSSPAVNPFAPNPVAVKSNPFAAFGAPSSAPASAFGPSSESRKRQKSPFDVSDSERQPNKNNPFASNGNKRQKSPFEAASDSEGQQKKRNPFASNGGETTNDGSGPAVKKHNPFGGASAFGGGNAFGGNNAFGGSSVPKPQTAAPSTVFGASSAQSAGPSNAFGAGASKPNQSTTSTPSSALTPIVNPSELNAHEPRKSADPYARKVYEQLRRDNLSPPSWPSQPGNPKNKAEMARFRDKYEVYREKVRASLTKASLMDDPNKRKNLSEAIEFKGICEDMCPQYELIQRITEVDVMRSEKDPATGFAVPSRMVKKLARSSAGQETPLPMDVRSVISLRQSLDYMVDNMLSNDENLPSCHAFMWDRTRSIRRDFAFFSSLNPEELKTQIYVLENIARFHITALHLISQEGKAPEDYSAQQELEQLGKTLLSLRDVYNDCNELGMVCENEAEFRAYYLIFHGRDPSILETLQRQWRPALWKESDLVRTAVSLIEAMQSTQDFHGPLKGGPSLAAASAYLTYFRIVESPKVSYTMACFAECHFPHIRRSILSAVKKGLRRPMGATKDVTAEVLNRFLRFDDVQQAIDFAEQHDMAWRVDPQQPNDPSRKYLDLENSEPLAHPRKAHQYSYSLVEKKRGSRSIADAIHNTIFEDSAAAAAAQSQMKKQQATLSAPSTSQFAASTSPETAPKPNPSPFGQPAAAPSQNGFGGNTASPFAQPAQNGPSNTQQPNQPPKTNPFGATAGGASNSFASSFTGSSVADSKGAAPSQPTTASTFNFGNKEPSAPPKQTQSTSFFPKTTTTPPTSPPIASKPQSFFPQSTQPVSVLGGASNSHVFPPAQPSAMEATKQLSNNSSQSVLVSAASTAPSNAAGGQQAPTGFPPKAPAASSIPSSFAAASPFAAPSTSNAGAPSILSSGSKDLFAPPKTAKETPPTSMFATGKPESTAAAKALQPAAPLRDLMGDFTSWYLMGDNGLLDEFKAYILEDLLTEVYDKYHAEEIAARIREEEEALQAEADAFREHSISVKYFYQWKQLAREKRLRTVRRKARDEARVFFEQQRAAEAQARKAAAERVSRQKAQIARQDRPEELNRLLKEQKRKRRRQAEEALLQSGVLAGVANERDAVADAVRREMSPSVDGSVNGAYSVRSRSGSRAGSRSRGGSKTRALREELLGGGPVGFRRSLPSMSDSARSSLEPERGTSQSRASVRWKLKAMGITQMADGTAVPDNLANEMLYGNGPRRTSGSVERGRSSRRASLSNNTLQDSIMMPPPRSTPAPRGFSEARASPTKRKRPETATDDEDADDNDDGTKQKDPKARALSHKRVMSSAEQVLSELRALRMEMEEGSVWFKEQNERLQSEAASRGSTPWDGSI